MQDKLVEPEADDFSLDDFDETISASLEETHRGMKALTLSGAQEREFRAMQNKLVDGLIEEMKEHRHQMSKVVESLNRKASKGALDQHAKAVSAGVDKRLDTIRNWALLAVGAIGTGLAVVNALKK